MVSSRNFGTFFGKIWQFPRIREESRNSGSGDTSGHIETQEVGAGGVLIDCGGRFPADQEALGGPEGLRYYPPSRTLPGAFFPFEGRVRCNYHQPLVAVQVRPTASCCTSSAAPTTAASGTSPRPRREWCSSRCKSFKDEPLRELSSGPTG